MNAAADPHDYDLVILGGGPGGYVAAIRAAQLGMRVALIEREAVGGVCLNWGCIPAKSLLRGAELATLLQDAASFGVNAELGSLDLGRNVERSREVVHQIVGGVESLLARHGVTVIRSAGVLRDARTVVTSGGPIRGRNIILAPGARPRAIEGAVVDGTHVLDSRAALGSHETPQSVVIVGGGCVGVEFADIFAAYGAHVTLVEHSAQLLDGFDEELAARLREAFAARGIEVLTGARVASVVPSGPGIRATVTSEGGAREIEAERALIAVGIVPNTDSIGLDRVGVATDERGYITIDANCQTSVVGVYGIGDATGILPLAHVASAQGVLAVEAIAGLEPEPLDYDWMPRAVYSRPQMGAIGLTEAAARARGRDVVVGRVPFAANGKATLLGASRGLAKLVSDRETGELLGFHAIGEGATELLAEVGVAHALESTTAEIAAVTHAHPTLSELVKEAALAARGAPVHHYQPRPA